MSEVKYSVLMSVYVRENAQFLAQSLDSMLAQTVAPDEIVLVKDGPLTPELDEVISGYVSRHSSLFNVVVSEENIGLGRALALGLDACRNEIVVRMDSDDIAVADRVEKQLACFEKDENLSIVGSNISEFCDDITNVISRRIVPQSHEDICEYLKKRCPLNHMTVVFKKSEVLKAGGYQHWFYNEDSYLWVRMYLAGCKFLNLEEDLVFARINQNTFKRRGGYKYYKSERDLFKFMKQNKIITGWEYTKAKFIRFVVQVLMPNSVRQWFFKKFARNKQ